MPLNSLPPSLTRTDVVVASRMLVHTKDIYFVIMIIFVSVHVMVARLKNLGPNPMQESNRIALLMQAAYVLLM